MLELISIPTLVGPIFSHKIRWYWPFLLWEHVKMYILAHKTYRLVPKMDKSVPFEKVQALVTAFVPFFW